MIRKSAPPFRRIAIVGVGLIGGSIGLAVRRSLPGTRVVGIPELVVEGESGLLVEAGDVEGLARAIRQVLEDPALGTRLAAAEGVRCDVSDGECGNRCGHADLAGGSGLRYPDTAANRTPS